MVPAATLQGPPHRPSTPWFVYTALRFVALTTAQRPCSGLLKEAFALIAEFEFLDGMPVEYRAFSFYDCEGGYIGGKGENGIQIGN